MPADAGPIFKNPADILNYGMQFGNQPEIVNGVDALPLSGGPAVSYVAIPNTMPGVNSLVITATQYSGTLCVVGLSGGTTGYTYLVTVRATYQSGRERALTGAVVVDDGAPRT